MNSPDRGSGPSSADDAVQAVDDSSADDIVDAEIVEEPNPPSAVNPGESGTVGSPSVPGASLPASTAFAPVGGTVPGVDYTDAGVPTLDYVRAKVEGRMGTAQGAAELATAAADRGREQTMAEQQEAREKAAADRLADIRASLGQPKP